MSPETSLLTPGGSKAGFRGRGGGGFSVIRIIAHGSLLSSPNFLAQHPRNQ